jgi:hypothetical protein
VVEEIIKVLPAHRHSEGRLCSPSMRMFQHTTK